MIHCHRASWLTSGVENLNVVQEESEWISRRPLWVIMIGIATSASSTVYITEKYFVTQRSSFYTKQPLELCWTAQQTGCTNLLKSQEPSQNSKQQKSGIKVNTEDPQILGAIIWNFVSMATWHPDFCTPAKHCYVPHTMHNFRLLPQCEWDFCSSGTLRSVDW